MAGLKALKVGLVAAGTPVSFSMPCRFQDSVVLQFERREQTNKQQTQMPSHNRQAITPAFQKVHLPTQRSPPSRLPHQLSYAACKRLQKKPSSFQTERIPLLPAKPTLVQTARILEARRGRAGPAHSGSWWCPLPILLSLFACAIKECCTFPKPVIILGESAV